MSVSGFYADQTNAHKSVGNVNDTIIRIEAIKSDLASSIKQLSNIIHSSEQSVYSYYYQNLCNWISGGLTSASLTSSTFKNGDGLTGLLKRIVKYKDAYDDMVKDAGTAFRIPSQSSVDTSRVVSIDESKIDYTTVEGQIETSTSEDAETSISQIETNGERIYVELIELTYDLEMFLEYAYDDDGIISGLNKNVIDDVIKFNDDFLTCVEDFCSYMRDETKIVDDEIEDLNHLQNKLANMINGVDSSTLENATGNIFRMGSDGGLENSLSGINKISYNGVDYNFEVTNDGTVVPVPVDGYRETSQYGGRYYEGNEFHQGLDLGAPGGTPVVAMASGAVAAVGDVGDGYGTKVVIKQDDGNYALYAHFRQGSTPVELNQRVEAGEVIGEVGSTGRSSGNHLHLQVNVGIDNVNDVYKKETTIDPRYYFDELDYVGRPSNQTYDDWKKNPILYADWMANQNN